MREETGEAAPDPVPVARLTVRALDGIYLRLTPRAHFPEKEVE